MTDPFARAMDTARPQAHDREATAVLLLHEALARSRQQEAERAAREHALARQLTAGRRWSVLARFAERRAARARTAAGAPLDRSAYALAGAAR